MSNEQDKRVRVMIFSKDSQMFIASNMYSLTSGSSVRIPILKWITKSNEILTVYRICYSKEKAQEHINEYAQQIIMHGPDIYHIVDEQKKTICCVWKPDILEPLIIEIAYEFPIRSHKLINVNNTEQVIDEIKKGFDIIHEEKTPDYQIGELII